MSWSLKFDEPIALAKGKPLRTLRDAANYAMALPKRESALPHWQLAVECLLSAAEKRGPVMIGADACHHGGSARRLFNLKRIIYEPKFV